MDLIDRIRSHEILSLFIEKECKENNISINLDLKIDKSITLKVDKYYNSLNIDKPPKSPDCLITIKCYNTSYKFCLVELKSGEFEMKSIIEKFETALIDFIGKRFPDILNDCYKSIELYAIINNPRSAHLFKIKSSVIYRKSPLQIRVATNNKTIKPCY